MPKGRLSEALKKRLGGGIALKPIVPREAGVSVLMNPSRQRIFQYVCSYPGRHVRAIERDLKLKIPTVLWHLKRLEQAGFVLSAHLRRKKAFYPAGLIPPEDIQVVALLENRHVRAICAALLSKSPQTQAGICRETGMYQQAAMWYLLQLEAAGIVAKRKSGRQAFYEITPRIESVKEHCAGMWGPFKSSLFARLAKDGVAPKVVRDDRKGVIIQLDTGQRKFNLKVEKI